MTTPPLLLRCDDCRQMAPLDVDGSEATVVDQMRSFKVAHAGCRTDIHVQITLPLQESIDRLWMADLP